MSATAAVGASGPRPRHAFGPVAGSLVAVAAWFAVAHSSGDGWVQALGSLLTGFLVIGLVAPALAVRRARCAVTDSPADAVAGRPCRLTLSVTGGAVVRVLDPPGPATGTGAGGTLTVETTPAHRCLRAECLVEIASASPFGLLWWSKRVILPLPRPLHVAPPPATTGSAVPVAGGTTGESEAARRPGRVGETRGVRDYQPGDPPGWVHWRATAHAGSLMVREMDAAATPPVRVDARLPDDPTRADEAAGQILATVARLLATGRSVILVTVEPAGTVARAVSSQVEAGRRLGRALPLVPIANPRRRRPALAPSGSSAPEAT